MKQMLIEGMIWEPTGARWGRLVVTGSANFDSASAWEMADLHLIVDCSTTPVLYEAYVNHWDWLCALALEKNPETRFGELDCGFSAGGFSVEPGG